MAGTHTLLPTTESDVKPDAKSTPLLAKQKELEELAAAAKKEFEAYRLEEEKLAKEITNEDDNQTPFIHSLDRENKKLIHETTSVRKDINDWSKEIKINLTTHKKLSKLFSQLSEKTNKLKEAYTTSLVDDESDEVKQIKTLIKEVSQLNPIVYEIPDTISPIENENSIQASRPLPSDWKNIVDQVPGNLFNMTLSIFAAVSTLTFFALLLTGTIKLNITLNGPISETATRIVESAILVAGALIGYSFFSDAYTNSKAVKEITHANYPNDEQLTLTRTRT